RFALRASPKTAEMPEVPQRRARSVADAMRDEGSAAIQFGGLSWPCGLIFAWVGTHGALAIEKFHRGREICQPHVRRKNILCRGVPATIVHGSTIRETRWAGVIQPSTANPIRGDGTHEDSRVL